MSITTRPVRRDGPGVIFTVIAVGVVIGLTIGTLIEYRERQKRNRSWEVEQAKVHHDEVTATVFVPNGRTFPLEIKATGLVVIKLGELQIQEADTKKTWTFSPGTWYMRSE